MPTGFARRIVPLIVLAAPLLVRAQGFEKQVIYQIVTDRFFDGDPSNNNPAQSQGLYDPTHTQWWMYWGGDFAGIEQKMSYLANLGVTAIWISPAADNINLPMRGFGGNTWTGYHGYWTRDFKRIDEHFGDARNSWREFDALVRAAHLNHIKVIADFAPNHSNPDDAAEFGALYDDGKLLAKPSDDPLGYFHHNPTISNYDDPYQVQYYKLADLADLNQENPVIDKYLKDAARLLQDHGADAFRVDAVKHCTWGWLYRLSNAIYAHRPSFIFGEWFQGSTQDKLYFDSVKFANRSGMSLLDYPLSFAIRAVFSGVKGFDAIDQTLEQEDREFERPNDLVTFVDNHDNPRLQSAGVNQDRLNEALGFLLTARGIPIVYYGDEQYLHNDTNQGRDPFDRNPMTAWDQTTTAYRMIQKLARLRRTNDALAYGSMKKRWINPDVYVFERQFFANVVLVAINRSDTTSYPIAGLKTDLSTGHYGDYLDGLVGGQSISVRSGNAGEQTVADFTLAPHSVAVWEKSTAPRGPEIGSIWPAVGQPGMKVTIAGAGLGEQPGTVRLFGLRRGQLGLRIAAKVLSWSPAVVVVEVPKAGDGTYQVELRDSRKRQARNVALCTESCVTEPSDNARFTVLAGPLIPVTFTVKNVPLVKPRQGVFVTGNVWELGSVLAPDLDAAGPMLGPHPPDYFLCVSVPQGVTLKFKFVIGPYGTFASKEVGVPAAEARLLTSNAIIQEAGPDHTYIVPRSGTGRVTVDWQR